MGKCINHPDRETSYLCMKHSFYLCEECLKCRDPEIYCKFRPSCPIWFLSKKKQKRETEDKDSIDFKALGYRGDPIIFGGRFKKLPLGTGKTKE